MEAGLATHYIPRAKLEGLSSKLSSMGDKAGDAEAIDAVLKEMGAGEFVVLRIFVTCFLSRACACLCVRRSKLVRALAGAGGACVQCTCCAAHACARWFFVLLNAQVKSAMANIHCNL
jgi:hypothetical protein